MSKYCLINVRKQFPYMINSNNVKFIQIKSYDLILLNPSKTIMVDNVHDFYIKRCGRKKRSSMKIEQEKPILIASSTGPGVPQWMVKVASILNKEKITNLAEIKYVIKEIHPTAKLKI